MAPILWFVNKATKPDCVKRPKLLVGLRSGEALGQRVEHRARKFNLTIPGRLAEAASGAFSAPKIATRTLGGKVQAVCSLKKGRARILITLCIKPLVLI